MLKEEIKVTIYTCDDYESNPQPYSYYKKFDFDNMNVTIFKKHLYDDLECEKNSDSYVIIVNGKIVYNHTYELCRYSDGHGPFGNGLAGTAENDDVESCLIDEHSIKAILSQIEEEPMAMDIFGEYLKSIGISAEKIWVHRKKNNLENFNNHKYTKYFYNSSSHDFLYYKAIYFDNGDCATISVERDGIDSKHRIYDMFIEDGNKRMCFYHRLHECTEDEKDKNEEIFENWPKIEDDADIIFADRINKYYISCILKGIEEDPIAMKLFRAYLSRIGSYAKKDWNLTIEEPKEKQKEIIHSLI